MALAFRGESCADNSGSWSPLDKSHNQQPTSDRSAYHKITHFGGRVIGIREQNRKGIVEGRDSLIEGHPVLPEIGRSLLSVPFELIGHLANLRYALGK